MLLFYIGTGAAGHGIVKLALAESKSYVSWISVKRREDSPLTLGGTKVEVTPAERVNTDQCQEGLLGVSKRF